MNIRKSRAALAGVAACIAAGTARFTITVTDSGTPVRESLSARFAITIAK
jgi:hypothetical protein